MGIKNNKFKMPIILIITIVIILLFVCIIYKCVNLSKNKTTYIEINYNELIEKSVTIDNYGKEDENDKS